MSLHVGNPVALVQWAVKAGRIPAVDEALWLARLTGAGADAYAEQLLGDMRIVTV